MRLDTDVHSIAGVQSAFQDYPKMGVEVKAVQDTQVHPPVFTNLVLMMLTLCTGILPCGEQH